VAEFAETGTSWHLVLAFPAFVVILRSVVTTRCPAFFARVRIWV